MTLSEFKAWLDGFEAAMGDAPTPDQWAKIKAKLAEVQAVAINPAMWRPPGYRSPSDDSRRWQFEPTVTCELPIKAEC